MTVAVSFAGDRITTWWRCDGCAEAETAPRTPDDPPSLPLGWAWLDFGGNTLHCCPECRMAVGLDPGCNTIMETEATE